MADDTLSKGALKLVEDLDSLKQQICDLKCEDQSGNEQVKTRVETVQTQVKQLLAELSGVEGEKMALEERVVNLENTVETLKEREKNLEAEVEILKTQVKQLLAENGKLEGEKMALEERVVNLEDTVESLKKGNVNLRDAVKSLKEGNVNLKQENVSLQCKITCLSDEVAQLKGSDDELLLGQLCWWIQSMIFKKVLPPYEYNKNVGYKLDRIKKEIRVLKNEDIEQSKQAWAKLQDELSLSEWDVKILAKAMRDTQSQRNYTAHPELTEHELFESANRMNDKGELKTSYENITKLIGLWKTLEKME